MKTCIYILVYVCVYACTHVREYVYLRINLTVWRISIVRFINDSVLSFVATKLSRV